MTLTVRVTQWFLGGALCVVLGCGGNASMDADGSGGATSDSDGTSTQSGGSNSDSSSSGGDGGGSDSSDSTGSGAASDGSGGSNSGSGGGDSDAGGTGGSSNQPVEGTPAPEDFPEYTKGPYGYCAPVGFGIPQLYCPENSAGGGQQENCLEYCSCQVSCTSDPDCPVPETGTSEPVCDNGECTLPCENADCPEGMRCIEQNDGKVSCVWAREGEENLSCWLQMNPDYCEQFTTKESCQERMTTDPLKPTVGCIWVVETIHSTASTSCEPAATTESCVSGAREDCDREGLVCPENGSWVHFRDIGAGTAALMVTDACFVPGGPFGSASGEACSFGEPSLPLLCDCACQE